MATCQQCGTTILFGGVSEGGMRFCGKACAARSPVLQAANRLNNAVVEQIAREIHQGRCPVCHGPGPVDIHTSHWAASIFVLTFWKSPTRLSCRSCGRNALVRDTLISVFVGWWGIPFGLILTPIQIVRNFIGIVSPPSELQPSNQLLVIARQLAAQRALAQPAPAAPPQPGDRPILTPP